MNDDIRILIDDITGWCVHYLTESDEESPVYILHDQFHIPDPWGMYAHHVRSDKSVHNSIWIAIYNARQIRRSK